MGIAEAIWRMKGLDVSHLEQRHQDAWNVVVQKLEAIMETGIIAPQTRVNPSIVRAITRLERELPN